MSTLMSKSLPVLSMTITLLISGCASDGNSRVSIGMGMGSFGSSGGVSGSVSTDVPVGGKSDARPLPIEQLPLDDAVITTVFPDKTLPFTASSDDVEALAQYVDADTQPGLDDKARTKLDKCVAEEAQCRIRKQE